MKTKKKQQDPRTGKYCGDCDQHEYIECPNCGPNIYCNEYDEDLDGTGTGKAKRCVRCINDGPRGINKSE